MKHNVLTKSEIYSRYEISLENYCKTIHIEALTMIDMVKKEIIPSSISYQNELVQLLASKKVCGDYESVLEEHLIRKLSSLSSSLFKKLEELENSVLETKAIEDGLKLTRFYRDTIFANMSELRLISDELETIVAKKHWSLPTYAEILYSVN